MMIKLNFGTWMMTGVVGFCIITFAHQGESYSLEVAATPTAKLQPVLSGSCQHSYFYRVKTPDGKPLKVVRNGRSDDSVVGQVPNGALVLFNEPRVTTYGDILAPEGIKGQADRRYLVRVQLGSSQFRGKMQVRTLDPGGFVNLRHTPSATARILGTLADGLEVTVKGYANSIDPDEPNWSIHKPSRYWYYVTLGNNLQGYVNSQFLVCE